MQCLDHVQIDLPMRSGDFLSRASQHYTLLCPSIHLSVGLSPFYVLFYFYSLSSLLLPKWANDLKYGHYPPSHDWCSSVSGLVLELVSQVIMLKSLFMNVVGQAEAWSWSRNPHANTKELQWTWNCFHVLNFTFVCRVGFTITAKHSNPRYWVVWEVEQYPSLYKNWKIWKRSLWVLTD